VTASEVTQSEATSDLSPQSDPIDGYSGYTPSDPSLSKESEVVTSPASQQLQAVTPVTDFSTYPARNSDDERHKQKRATKCKEQMLACRTKEELETFKAESGYSETEIKWVWNNFLTNGEKEKVKAVSDSSQGDLFEQADQPTDFTLPVQVGDKIKYQTWTGEPVTTEVTAIEEQECALEVGSSKTKRIQRIYYGDYSISSDSPDLLAIFDSWGKKKWTK
jgi:hypothetical protein